MSRRMLTKWTALSLNRGVMPRTDGGLKMPSSRSLSIDCPSGRCAFAHLDATQRSKKSYAHGGVVCPCAPQHQAVWAPERRSSISVSFRMHWVVACKMKTARNPGEASKEPKSTKAGPFLVQSTKKTTQLSSQLPISTALFSSLPPPCDEQKPAICVSSIPSAPLRQHFRSRFMIILSIELALLLPHNASVRAAGWLPKPPLATRQSLAASSPGAP